MTFSWLKWWNSFIINQFWNSRTFFLLGCRQKQREFQNRLMIRLVPSFKLKTKYLYPKGKYRTIVGKSSKSSIIFCYIYCKIKGCRTLFSQKLNISSWAKFSAQLLPDCLPACFTSQQCAATMLKSMRKYVRWNRVKRWFAARPTVLIKVAGIFSCLRQSVLWDFSQWKDC